MPPSLSSSPSSASSPPSPYSTILSPLLFKAIGRNKNKNKNMMSKTSSRRKADPRNVVHVHGFVGPELPAFAKKVFEGYGEIVEILAFRTRTTNRAHVFVEYASRESAERARGKFSSFIPSNHTRSSSSPQIPRQLLTESWQWQGDPIHRRDIQRCFERLDVEGRREVYRWDGMSALVPVLLPGGMSLGAYQEWAGYLDGEGQMRMGRGRVSSGESRVADDEESVVGLGLRLGADEGSTGDPPTGPRAHSTHRYQPYPTRKSNSVNYTQSCSNRRGTYHLQQDVEHHQRRPRSRSDANRTLHSKSSTKKRSRSSSCSSRNTRSRSHSRFPEHVESYYPLESSSIKAESSPSVSSWREQHHVHSEDEDAEILRASSIQFPPSRTTTSPRSAPSSLSAQGVGKKSMLHKMLLPHEKREAKQLISRGRDTRALDVKWKEKSTEAPRTSLAPSTDRPLSVVVKENELPPRPIAAISATDATTSKVDMDELAKRRDEVEEILQSIADSVSLELGYLPSTSTSSLPPRPTLALSIPTGPATQDGANVANDEKHDRLQTTNESDGCRESTSTSRPARLSLMARMKADTDGSSGRLPTPISPVIETSTRRKKKSVALPSSAIKLGGGRAEASSALTSMPALEEGRNVEGGYPSPAPSPLFGALDLPGAEGKASETGEASALLLSVDEHHGASLRASKAAVDESAQEHYVAQIQRLSELYQLSQEELAIERKAKRKAEDAMEKERGARRKLEDEMWAVCFGEL